MKVLDLDLDFFLEDCCPLAEMGKRPEVNGHEPWEEKRIREFLEKQCRLSSKPRFQELYLKHMTGHLISGRI